MKSPIIIELTREVSKLLQIWTKIDKDTLQYMDATQGAALIQEVTTIVCKYLTDDEVRAKAADELMEAYNKILTTPREK